MEPSRCGAENKRKRKQHREGSWKLAKGRDRLRQPLSVENCSQYVLQMLFFRSYYGYFPDTLFASDNHRFAQQSLHSVCTETCHTVISVLTHSYLSYFRMPSHAPLQVFHRAYDPPLSTQPKIHQALSSHVTSFSKMLRTVSSSYTRETPYSQ